jgi:hypothetical protein
MIFRSQVPLHILSALLLTLALIFLVSPARAEQVVTREYQLKAAFLHKFLGFIDWEHAAHGQETSGAEEPEVEQTANVPHREICILGDNPFGSSLERLVTLHDPDKKQVTVRVAQDLEDATTCSLLFISRSEKDRLKEVLERVRTLSIVTVSDIEGFAENGGIIELVVEGNHVRFIINSDRARENGIRVDSQLLALARKVRSVNGSIWYDVASA